MQEHLVSYSINGFYISTDQRIIRIDSSHPTAEATCAALNYYQRDGVDDIIIFDPSGAKISQIRLLELAIEEKEQADIQMTSDTPS